MADGPVPRCPHCGAEFTNTSARDSHAQTCSSNPNRTPWPLDPLERR